MRGQIAVISVVLISGIIISLVGAAYLWGMPLVEKRTIVTQAQTAESFILQVSDAIIDTANTGAGSKSIDIPFGSVKAVPFDKGDPYNNLTNAIIFEFTINQPMVFDVEVVPVKTSSLETVGIYGVDEARIITLGSESSGTAYLMRYVLHFRELDTATRAHRIALNEGGTTREGNQRITVSWDSTPEHSPNPQTNPREGYEQRDLVLTHIKVDVY